MLLARRGIFAYLHRGRRRPFSIWAVDTPGLPPYGQAVREQRLVESAAFDLDLAISRAFAWNLQ